MSAAIPIECPDCGLILEEEDTMGFWCRDCERYVTERSHTRRCTARLKMPGPPTCSPRTPSPPSRPGRTGCAPFVTDADLLAAGPITFAGDADLASLAPPPPEHCAGNSLVGRRQSAARTCDPVGSSRSVGQSRSRA
jgi:hypothetical protein